MDAYGWHDLATATQGRLLPSNAWGRSSRLSTDSRTLQPGDVFWALPGERFDGHDFCGAARERGASLIVCRADRASEISGPRLVVDDTLAALGRLARWHRRRHEALVIGVTGSVGKTTTKELIHAALSPQFRGLKNPGSFNNLVGLPLSLLELDLDHEFAVLEMGASRQGDLRELCQMAEPEIGVVTAIGKAHLATFGSVEGIIQGKGELLEALPPHGMAVLPGDDPVVRGMAGRARCRTVFVGTGCDNDVQAINVQASAREVTFDVDGVSFRVQLAGPAHLTNAMCAIGLAREVGVPLSLIAEGLEDFQPLAGRGAMLNVGRSVIIDDCYNASPTAVEAACERLSLVMPSAAGRRIAILGDMRELGTAAASEHRRVGELLARSPIDRLVAFGDHARDLADGAIRAGWRRDRIVATNSYDVLLTILDCWVEPGDVLLIKGSRAMQMERLVPWLTERLQDCPGLAPRRCA